MKKYLKAFSWFDVIIGCVLIILILIACVSTVIAASFPITSIP